MGAGGMIFVDPLYQRILVEMVRGKFGDLFGVPKALPVIYDEVFVGLYRLGLQTTASILGVHPDISVYAKILTGGLIPLAVTLASDPIFQVFNTDKKTDALLHGHSYTAHPIGCAVATESLRTIEKLSQSDSWEEAKGRWSPEEVLPLLPQWNSQ